MKSFVKSSLLLFVFLITSAINAQSQSLRLFGGDLINGTINGLALGGATMALQNSGDLGPLRVGLGGGILYGIGTGIYDNSINTKGQRFLKSGVLNDGRNSTIIVLLDTFYGAAGGAAIGAAITLLSKASVVDGLQYGSGAGAWIGFGFGLVDSFELAEGPNNYQASINHPRTKKAQGIVQFAPASSDDLSLGFLHPTVFTRKAVTPHSIKLKRSFGVQVVNLSVNF